MARHLLLRLYAPLTAFGGETIDEHGVTREFPALSMVTGLIANALGWDRGECERHDRLQARLRMGARRDLEPRHLRDYQTARLFQDDQGWTTSGSPEGRKPSSKTYNQVVQGRKSTTQQRYRDYHADLHTLIALRLEPADEAPTLDAIAAAIDRPARPLFIGRKPCMPAARLMAGWCEAEHVLGALRQAPRADREASRVLMQWPDGEGTLPGDRVFDLCDERNWVSGVHGGWRPVREGSIGVEEAQP